MKAKILVAVFMLVFFTGSVYAANYKTINPDSLKAFLELKSKQNELLKNFYQTYTDPLSPEYSSAEELLEKSLLNLYKKYKITRK